MGTRFGRRNADGNFEYHDSEAALIESARREASELRRTIFMVVGLVLGGILTYVLARKLGAEDWPKWLRMLVVLSGAGAAAFVLALLADLLWAVLRLSFYSAVMYLIGRLLWTVI